MPSSRFPSSNQDSRPNVLRFPGWAILTTSIAVYLGLTGFPANGGDILRGGTSVGARPGAPPRMPISPAQELATANAREALARTSRSIKAVQQMQAAARNLALNRANSLSVTGPLPKVPNGLKIGGLQVAPGVPKDLAAPTADENPGLWIGALLPKETVSGDLTKVTIKQTEPQAVLNWQTFNVGKKTSVVFNQKAGTAKDGSNNWIAFNKVNDPTGVPSQILGSIKADGAVYLINQNGIVFGGSSQVNLHSFVASSLKINDNLIGRLLNNPNGEFLFSASRVTDPSFTLVGATSYVLAESIVAGSTPTVTVASGTGLTTLNASKDFNLTLDGAGKPMLEFTDAGLAKIGGGALTVSYFNRQGGDIVVEAGARLTAPATAANVGGRISLIGPNVRNAGTISTPDGQTILAAGLEVGFAAHSTDDPTLRGLDTFIGAEGSKTGTATNSGLIDAPRASVVVAGKNVEQLGAIASTTSVSLNGRIDLLAEYDAVSSDGLANFAPFFPQTTGTVTFGANSTTRIVPELDNPETVVGTDLALEAQVNARGRAIHFAEDAMLLAPGADVTLRAGNWKLTGLAVKAPIHNFVLTSGQIYLDAGASINVAGSTAVSVPVAQNTLSVELRGSELADAPLQRDGIFRGLTIDVDLRKTGIDNGRYWIGTPLADAAGFAGLIQRTVGELTVEGGTVTLNAGESVVMQRGSTIDVSGGFVQYEAGMMKTTRVLVGGRLLPIEQASPDMLYDGIYTGQFTVNNPRYGISETWSNPQRLDGAHWEESYAQGANGGNISITAPSMALDGTLRGETLPGPRQRGVQPLPSSLTLAFKGQNPEPEAIFGDVVPYYSPTPPKIAFEPDASQRPTDPFEVDSTGNPAALRADRKEQVALSPKLLAESGFGTLTIENTDGNIVVPAGLALHAQPGGSITFSGANIDVQGSVSAPGGSLTFNTFNISPALAEFLLLDVNNPLTTTLETDPNRGRFSLGSDGSLSTAGLIVDDRAGIETRGTLALQTNGGNITIISFTSELVAGGVLDVSGGVTMGTNGRPTYGPGGAIVIRTGKDLSIASVRGGDLDLGAALVGYSGTMGGSLTVQASSIQVGGAASAPSTFLIQPEFFSQGGFTRFSLIGIGESLGIENEYSPGLAIAPGTIITPIAQNWLAIPHPGDGSAFELQTVLLPRSLRTPVSLAFAALQIENPFTTLLEVRGDLVMGRGAIITTDPRASVSFSGDTIALRGAVEAPAGSITISGASSLPIREEGTATNAQVTVHLGPTSLLSTVGTIVRTPNQFGNRTGVVLPGGSISVSGNIFAQRGATLDVSGASDVLDIHPSSLGLNAALDGSPIGSTAVPVSSGLTSPLYASLAVPARIDSDAGSITLRGGQELFTQATLRGDAGGPTALGGSLNISSVRFYVSGEPRTTADLNLVVTQGTDAAPSLTAGEGVIGQVLRDAKGNILEQMGHFAVNDFRAGGFDSLALGGNVQFDGPVTIHAARELTVARGGIIAANSEVNLTAPHVTLGQAFRTPLQPDQIQALRPFTQTDATGTSTFHPIATSGSGSLTVKADLIDVGNLSMQGVSKVNLLANGGEIRGAGTLDVAGNIRLRAAQIYPTTAVPFTISAADPNVVVTTSTTGSPTVKLASADLPAGFGVGSPLLGSTVAGIEGDTITLASVANATINRATPLVFAPGTGSVAIEASGTRQLPLSAGGQLNIYGSNIQQNGTLRAPIGQINIGWDGTGEAPLGELTGTSVAVTQKLSLGVGSVTSVSAIDPLTGQSMLIPYGYNPNGTSWIDPTGLDITAGGVPEKAVNLRADSLAMHHGALVDLQGGGDLFAYQFVRGIGGSTDILGAASSPWNVNTSYTAGTLVTFGGATWSARTPSQGQAPEVGLLWSRMPERFAVIPGYQSNYAPFAPFNSGSDATTNLASGNSGFSTGGLSVGDRVYLGESERLAAGVYTLLPARYALMPGAFLVTPQTSAPVSFQMSDQSSLVAGYRFNDLNDGRAVLNLSTRFEVSPGEVTALRAEYHLFSANGFLRTGAESQDLPAPRLPMDGGHVVFGGIDAMVLNGSVAAQAAFGARAGLADISTLADIVVGGAGAAGSTGQVVLNAARLSSWGAESLLIGGVREMGAKGTAISVSTSNVTVSNANSPLTAPEVIIVANENLTLAADARVLSRGTQFSPTQKLLLGDAAVAGSGDGLLLRVRSDPRAQVVRSGVSEAEIPTMTIAAGAQISGGSVTLDSTAATTLDPDARLDGRAINLASGRVSIAFENAGELNTNPGLVLSDKALSNVQASGTLSLLGYSSIDFYGTGEFSASGRLALHAAAIRGFNTGGGVVAISADRISLDNAPGRAANGAAVPLDGTLAFNADTITLGENRLAIGNFDHVALNASEGIRVRDTGSFVTPGALEIMTPVVAAAAAANHSIEATGALTMQAPADSTETGFASGLGAALVLTGASVVDNTNIVLPSGSLTLRATNGDVIVGNRAETRLDVGGTAKQFYDLVRYTGGGQINLIADTGSVMLAEGGTLAVDARPDGGNAGGIKIAAARGDFALEGEIVGQGGTDGRNGSFALDVATVPGGALGELNSTLDAGGFTDTRSLRIRTGDILVDGLATARTFDLSTDAGSITVTGTINAAGRTGGTINLRAFESVVLDSGAVLTVAGNRFSNAGKGGAVSLEAGSQVGGLISTAALLDVRGGSTINLSVGESTAASEPAGRFAGTLHLRAPQNAAGTDLQLASIDGQVLGASSIVVEGYKLYTPAGGNITSSVQAEVRANGEGFIGVDGTPAAGYDAMHDRILANDSGLHSLLAIVPGAELINLAGDLTLGSENSAPSDDWNLAAFRFGPKSAAGVLTLRASENLVFSNALNDGFTAASFTAPLIANNPQLPANAQSWSYRLTAGADLTTADFTRVQSLDALGGGSLRLGKNAGLLQGNNPGPDATTASLLNPSPSLSYFQTIRTGSGDITISTGRDVQLLNQFATIYTAGTRVADATTLFTTGDFSLPIVAPLRPPNQGVLGASQQNYLAQYSRAGGNVSINAGADITHLTRNNSGTLIADSTRQLPNNWLYRRGYVDPLTGEFGAVGVGSGFGSVNDPAGSTTWWIDFSNFFQGVGALGGGDVTMTAGHDVANVDAVIPTNARMPKGRPDASKLIELGGGDLFVSAGNDISGGVYYVERGHGTLAAGNSIHTNQTRTPSLGILAFNPEVLPAATWLPTTLFAGQSTFDVSANGDVLLGPVANTFLLPQGLQNKFWNRTYFTTYAPDAAVDVFSLGGDVTLQTAATLPDQSSADPLLEIWLRDQLLLGANSASAYHPWLRLAEASAVQFTGISSLMPSTVRATALSGDLNLAGDLTLFPSPTGTIELAAAGSINGLQPNGISTRLIPGQNTVSWSSSTINLSDADPTATPGLTSPLAFSYVGVQSVTAANATNDFIFDLIDLQFRESGSSSGVFGALQTKQALHAQGPLHANDPDPVRLYATGGNIAGLTLFSGKSARVLADRDITDIELYIQNVSSDDVSVVAAGRDIVAFNASSPLRVGARSVGNSPAATEIPLAGDIQISGPGTLEVLAGRNIDLGVGPSNLDGTGLGIVSIGNARNPFLSFDGASVVAGAGIGFANGLAGSTLEFDRFLDTVDSATVADILSEVNSERPAGAPPLQLDNLSSEQRSLLALEVFFRVLREAGRDSSTTQNYDAGFAAIDDLFGNVAGQGDILLTSREIKTANGGRISLFAPTGGLVVGFDVPGNQALDQGVLTERGGAISIFTDQSVTVGTSRIFTLRGGDIVIWASEGDIAAGASSKTVQSAPPTRVLIDPQTADVKTDLSGLATGGGIGVLATVKNVPPGNVDLIAPAGTVDAGDAGVRASGNITVAAAAVANSTNFSSGGSSSGVPAASSGASAPSLGGLSAASSASSAASNAANDATRGQERPQTQTAQELPSIVTVEVIGYGGGSGAPDSASGEDEEERKKKEEEAALRNSGASAVSPIKAGA